MPAPAPNACPAPGADRLDPGACLRGPLRTGVGLLGALVVLHPLLVTPLTHSLDEVKLPAMWIGGALLMAAAGWLWMRGAARPMDRWIVGAALAFPAVCVVGVLAASPDFAKWIGWREAGTRLCLLGWMAMAWSACSTARGARWVLRFVVVAALSTCAIGLLQYSGFLGRIAEAMAAGPAPAGGRPRHLANLMLSLGAEPSMTSTVLNPQFFANLLVLCIPVAASSSLLEAMEARRSPSRAAARWAGAGALAALAGTLCVFLTLSKASIFVLPVGGLLLAGLWWAALRRSGLRVPHWPLAAGLAALLLASGLFLARDDIAARFRTIDQSLTSRGVIYPAAAAMWAESPLLGAGPGSFILRFPEHRSPEYHLTDLSNVTLSAHNWVLDIASTTGALGLAAYLALLGLVAWRGVAALGRSPSRAMRVAVAGWLAGTALLYASNLATPMLAWPVGLVAAAAALGALAGTAATAVAGDWPQGPKSSSAPPGRGLVFGRIALAGGVVLLAVMGWRGVAHFRGAMEHADAFRASARADLVRPTSRAEAAAQGALLREAVDGLRRSVAINPSFVTAHYRLGGTLSRLAEAERALHGPAAYEARLREAIDAYERLRGFAPRYSEVALNLAVVHNALGESLRPRALAEEDPAAREALVAEARGHLDAAMEWADEAVRTSTKVTVLFVAAGVREEASALWPEGSEEARRLAALAADGYEAALEAPLMQRGGQRAAEEDLKAQARLRAPAMRARSGDPAGAARAWERAMESAPADDALLRRAAANWIDAGKTEEVERLFSRALERHPVDAQLLLLRADLAQQRGEDIAGDLRFIEALDHLRPGLLDQTERAALRALLTRAGLAPAAFPPPGADP